MPTAFSRSVKVFVDQNLSPSAQSQQLADVAKQGVADLISSGQASPRYERFVDGTEGASEDSVRPLGTIVYIFEYLGDVVSYALGFLTTRSPVRTGRYRDSFFVAVNGRAIPAAAFDAASLDVGSEIIIYNTQPYNRKVDVQIAGNKRLSFSVPAGIWDDCAQSVKSRFGNTVTAKRLSNVDFPGKYTLRQRQMRTDRPHQVLRGIGEAIQSPGLSITALGL